MQCIDTDKALRRMKAELPDRICVVCRGTRCSMHCLQEAGYSGSTDMEPNDFYK